MSQRIVYVAFGGNIGDSRWIFRDAKAELRELLGGLVGSSRLYRSTPMIPTGEDPGSLPPYLNALAAFDTGLSPSDTLSQLLAIESRHGRIRGSRWGSRTLDLDIVAYGEEIIDLPDLSVPHPQMHLRDFVLYPFADVNPYYLHPILGKTVVELAEALPPHAVHITEVDDSAW